jgi:hypothetical protein
MKNAGKTTFDVSFGGMPRRDSDSRSDESGAGFIDRHALDRHTFPKVPRLRRRVIPRIPVARREDMLRPSSSQDSLPRAVALETRLPEAPLYRRHVFAVLAVGLVLGVCTALFRFANARFP